jgi:hypothetical protein
VKISQAWDRGIQRSIQWGIFTLASGKQVVSTLVCKCWGNERKAVTGYAFATWLPLAISLGIINRFLVTHGVLSHIPLGIYIKRKISQWNNKFRAC